MMGVFNNLVMFDQHVPQNSLESIVPDLASSWSWSEDGKELTFKLRQGVKWHDGKPFTAKDVKCTWDLISRQGGGEVAGQSAQVLVPQPRRSDRQRRLRGHVPPEAAAALVHRAARLGLVAGLSRAMCRRATCAPHPIGTGPFKFVEFKPNESIKVARNPDYWKPGRPYLDAIEYTMMPNPATAILAFAAGKFDRTWQGIMSLPLMKQLKDQVPNAECAVVPWNIPRQMLVNRSKPPFDNPELRRAMVLTLDRRAFIDILSDGQGEIGGAMMPPPAGSWGMPPEVLQTLPGYGPDVAKNRAEAREIMKKLGYGPDKRLAVTVTTRNAPAYRDPAVLLIDQLKEIYIDGNAQRDRHDAMVSDRHAQGLHGRPDRQRERARRPRPAVLREFLLRRRAQLHRLLQCRGRQADRPAIERARYRASASRSSGKSSASWPRTRPARPSSTRCRRPAGSPISRATR